MARILEINHHSTIGDLCATWLAMLAWYVVRMRLLKARCCFGCYQKRTAMLMHFLLTSSMRPRPFLGLAIYTALFCKTVTGTRQAGVCSFYYFLAEHEEWTSQRHGTAVSMYMYQALFSSLLKLVTLPPPLMPAMQDLMPLLKPV